VNRGGFTSIVDEPDDCLLALLDNKGWSWGHAVIAQQGCRAFVRVNILSEFVDVDFIVVDRVVGDGVCDGPALVSAFTSTTNTRVHLTMRESSQEGSEVSTGKAMCTQGLPSPSSEQGSVWVWAMVPEGRVQEVLRRGQSPMPRWQAERPPNAPLMKSSIVTTVGEPRVMPVTLLYRIGWGPSLSTYINSDHTYRRHIFTLPLFLWTPTCGKHAIIIEEVTGRLLGG
jgi:hypothetical protein